MRPADVRFCEQCRRGTGHNRKGECMVCRSRARRATKRAKLSNLGKPLARYGDLLKIADALWSVWVRAGPEACEMCGVPFAPDAMQCAHGITREDRVIRFEPTNTYALCSACHRRHTPPRQAWWDWMEAHVGQPAYAMLQRRSRAGGKLHTSDLQLVILDAQQRIAALPQSERKEWAQAKAETILERLVRLGVAA
jgi:hypothetical protein